MSNPSNYNSNKNEEIAKSQLNVANYEYFRGGAYSEATLQENLKGLKRIKIIPRILKGIKNVDLRTKFQNKIYSLPFGSSPTALHQLANQNEKELGISSACYTHNIPMTLSLFSTSTLKEVTTFGTSLFLQTFIFNDEQIMKRLLREAEENGILGIVVTVDHIIPSTRESNIRNNFEVPDEARFVIIKPQGRASMNDTEIDSTPDTNWTSISHLKSLTKLPIILKGIQSRADVKLALEAKVDGIWISNHGGRQLDCLSSTMEILQDVSDLIQDSQTEIYIDGGFRNGFDVFKALALGANFVFFGRAFLYALAANGRKGVSDFITQVSNELEDAMRCCGAASIKDIKREMVQTIRLGTL